MPYCQHCGRSYEAGSRFCAFCGAELSADSTSYSSYSIPSSASVYEDASVMLTSLGSCTPRNAASLLSSVCGYTLADAQQIVSTLPITVARNLRDDQAEYLAQAMTEYGMDVSVYDSRGYRDLTGRHTSVFDSTGNLIASVAGVLGLIGLKNRITRDMYRRWDYPYRFEGNQPPRFRMQTPPPRPVTAPIHTPNPAPHRQDRHPAPASHPTGGPSSPGKPGNAGNVNHHSGPQDQRRGPGNSGSPGGPGGFGGPGGPGHRP